MSVQQFGIPADRRAQQGGLLFLTSLMVFFLASILLYGIYAYWRRDEAETAATLPTSFLISTLCLLVISGLLHVACSAVRLEQRRRLVTCLSMAILGALTFTLMQMWSLWAIIRVPEFAIAPNKGVAGMVIVLAVLHALHVLGGVIALALVTARAAIGRYDHERHWAIDFSATYWHFLDAVWLCMLAAFWLTTGGFQL